MKHLSIAVLLAFAAGPALAAPPSLSAEQLDEARGGFLVAGDVAFEFGAVVRTFANGALALATEVTWTDKGPVLTRTGDGTVLAGASIMQNLDRGELTNVLLNTGSGRSLRQETDITLTLPGFSETQGDMVRTLTGLRLNDELSAAAIGALR